MLDGNPSLASCDPHTDIVAPPLCHTLRHILATHNNGGLGFLAPFHTQGSCLQVVAGREGCKRCSGVVDSLTPHLIQISWHNLQAIQIFEHRSNSNTKIGPCSDEWEMRSIQTSTMTNMFSLLAFLLWPWLVFVEQMRGLYVGMFEHLPVTKQWHICDWQLSRYLKSKLQFRERHLEPLDDLRFRVLVLTLS